MGDIQGDVRFGGVVPSKAFLQRYTGFVEQFDTLIGSLTVEEMLMYTAYLKRPVTEGRDSKQQAVDELLEQLGLTRCKDVKIGDNMQKGISGGQVSLLT
jgi:ATP-binding cassette subfamily G (WHITE) protein 2